MKSVVPTVPRRSGTAPGNILAEPRLAAPPIAISPAAPPIAMPRPEAQSANRLPFYFAALLLFTHFARPFDVVLKGYKLPAIICSLCIVVVFLAGGARNLKTRVGIAFLAMVGWMCVSVPFSYWPGGSFNYVLWFAQFFLPLMLLVAVAAKSPKDIIKLSGVLAFSCLFHLILNASETGGRYSMNGTFGNPDDVALLAGFTIPFIVLICTRIKTPVFRYGLMIGGTGYLILVIGRTATRAAIPALIMMLGVYFFRGKGSHKLAIVASTIIGGTLAIFVLPDSAVDRLATVLEAFQPPAAAQFYDGLTEAQASTIERHELMKDAIETAVSHPIAGIGAGLFVQYRYDKMLRPDGTHKPYLPAHNTYLEIASECGIPGVILYLVFLWAVYTSIRKTLKLTAARANPEANLLWSIALAGEAALIYFATCAAFMTCDKHPHQFVLAGFAIAMYKMASSLPMGAPAAAPAAKLSMGPAPFGRQRPAPAFAR